MAEVADQSVSDDVAGSTPAQNPANDIGSTLSKSWDSIRASLLGTPNHDPRSSAYTLWIRWLHDCSMASEQASILYSERYWQQIQQGLRIASAEQRKYCLYILNKSVAMLDRDVDMPCLSFHSGQKEREQVLAAYEKYSVLFSTFVLDRYINQVQDSLADLGRLSQVKSLVSPGWIVVLLEASLQHGVQDSVRKVIGQAVMLWDMTALIRTEEWADFFILSFLPWACRGTLFTSSLESIGIDGGHLCRHGETLSSYVANLFHNTLPVPKVLSLVRQILNFIKDQGQKLVSFAAGSYLLVGCASGLRKLQHRCHAYDVLQNDLELLRDAANQTGLPEVAKDLHVTLCADIKSLLLQHSPGLSDSPEPLQEACLPSLETQARLLARRNVSKESCDLVVEDVNQLQQSTSLTAMWQLIESTSHRCLSRDGAVLALIHVRHLLNLGIAIQEECLHDIFTAIWAEIELQDYPKQAMMELPITFFNKHILIAADTKSRFLAFLSSKMLELQLFGEGRTYIFTTLAKVLHQLYLDAPGVVEKLPYTDYICRMVNYPPTAKSEFLLESALASILQRIFPSRRYEAYYGPRESIGYAAFFDMLNGLRPDDHRFGFQVIETLLEAWRNQKRPVPMISKVKTTQQLQVPLLLLPKFLEQQRFSHLTEQYLHDMLVLLEVEPLPRFRFLLEWMITALFSLKADHRSNLLEPLRNPDHENPKYLASLLKLAVHAARLPGAPETFGLQLATTMVATCASPKIAVRHESQWSFLTLWDHAVQQNWMSISSNPAFVALNQYIRCLDRYINPPPQRILENFDFKQDHTLTNLLCGCYLEIEPRQEALTSFEALASFMDKSRNVERRAFTVPLGVKARHSMIASKAPLPDVCATTSHVAVSAIQTKSATWQSHLDLDVLSSEEVTQRATRPITVVASHIAFAHNLGGISRAAESFGAEALVLAKASVLKDVAFKGVSVNSHLHLPIVEVPGDEDNTRGFLRKKREQGYGIVGVEQTDSSIVLAGHHHDRKVFPRQCVLVMGSEKEGIPGWLLAECDTFVEIPQVGVTRSLNVQTATAIALYEYGREWPAG